MQRLSAPPVKRLRVVQPTPYTVSYTVSTRPLPRTLPAYIASFVGLLLRIVVGISTVLLLWLRSRVESERTEIILLRVLGHLRANQLLALVDKCEWMYLASCALFIFVLVFRRNYTGMLFLFHTTGGVVSHLHRRVTHRPPRPRHPDFDLVLHIPPSTYDTLHTHDEHTRYIHIRGVQRLRGQILLGSRGGWRRGCGSRVPQLAAEACDT